MFDVRQVLRFLGALVVLGFIAQDRESVAVSIVTAVALFPVVIQLALWDEKPSPRVRMYGMVSTSVAVAILAVLRPMRWSGAAVVLVIYGIYTVVTKRRREKEAQHRVS